MEANTSDSSSPKTSPVNKGEFKDIVLTTAHQQISELKDADPMEVNRVLDNIIDMTEEFQKAADAHPHPTIREDTDIVWEIPGPGSFSSSLEDQPDRYARLPWSRNMDRARLRTSFAIVRKVTALRTHKPTSEVTQEDIAQHGPNLVYTGTPFQDEQFKHALASLAASYKFPPAGKIHMYDQIQNPDGTFRNSNNTADAVQSFQIPNGINPRRITVVSNAEHLVRFLHILGKFPEVIPPGTIVQPYPVHTTKAGQREYSVMEARGTLDYIYKKTQASIQPYPYSL